MPLDPSALTSSKRRAPRRHWGYLLSAKDRSIGASPTSSCPACAGGSTLNDCSLSVPNCAFSSARTRAEEAITHRGVLDAGVHFLHEPFSGTGLLEAVERVLR